MGPPRLMRPPGAPPGVTPPGVPPPGISNAAPGTGGAAAAPGTAGAAGAGGTGAPPAVNPNVLRSVLFIHSFGIGWNLFPPKAVAIFEIAIDSEKRRRQV